MKPRVEPEDERQSTLDRIVFVAVALPLFALYLVTASTDQPYSIDAMTNVVTAWSIGVEGTPILDEHAHLATPEQIGNLGWYVPSNRGTVSQYAPGTALLAAPAYALARPRLETVSMRGTNRPDLGYLRYPLPSFWPAAIVTAAVTALAAATMAVVLLEVVEPRMAVAAAYLLGVGTSAWSVAADALWQHGPGMLWVALAMWAASRRRPWVLAVAGAMLAVTRPPLVVIPTVLAVAWGVSTKRVAALVPGGAGVALGLTALLGYNRWLFGQWTVSGGYGTDFTDNFMRSDLVAYAQNVAGALIDAERGLLVYSPFLVVLTFGLVAGWRGSAWWSRAGFVGGIMYLLIQLKANRFSGGDGFLFYRYPLEPLVAMTPLLTAAFTGWVQPRRARRLVFIATVVFAIAAHTWAAFALR